MRREAVASPRGSSPTVKNPQDALGMVSDAFNDRCRNFGRRRSCAGGGPAQHLWQLPRTRPKGILRRNMTYIVPPVWTACLRERFAGSTFVDVIEADVRGDVTCCSDRVKPSSAVPSLLFRAFASSGLPRRLFDRKRRRADPGPTRVGCQNLVTPANRHVVREDTGFATPHGLRSVQHTHDPSIQAGSSALLSTRANGDERQLQRSAYRFL